MRAQKTHLSPPKLRARVHEEHEKAKSEREIVFTRIDNEASVVELDPTEERLKDVLVQLAQIVPAQVDVHYIALHHSSDLFNILVILYLI